jgi:hypothetical protein
LTNYDDYLSKIEFDTDDSEKSSLLFLLNQFFVVVNQALEYDYTGYKSKHFEPIFLKNNIPLTRGQVFLSIRNALPGEKPLIAETSIKKMETLKNTPEFKAALKSTEERLLKIIYLLNYRKNENESTRRMLLSYEPNLRLRYDKLVLEGSALQDSNQIAMELIDEKNGKWFVRTPLGEGAIIFKTRYGYYYFSWGSWANNRFNWQSEGNNRLHLRFWGDSIKVQPGNYSIAINLEEMTYDIEIDQD